MTLNEHLSACMAQSGLRAGGGGPSFDALHDAIAADRAMEAEARLMLAGASKVADRDHIARWTAAALRTALDGAHV